MPCNLGYRIAADPAQWVDNLELVAESSINSKFQDQGITRVGDPGFSRKATVMTSPTNFWVTGTGTNRVAAQNTLYEYTLGGFENTTDKDSETIPTATATGRSIGLFETVFNTTRNAYSGGVAAFDALSGDQKLVEANLDFYSDQEFVGRPNDAASVSGTWAWAGCGTYDAATDTAFIPVANSYSGGGEGFANVDKAALIIVSDFTSNTPTAVMYDTTAGSAASDFIVEMPTSWQTALGGNKYLAHGSTGTVSNNQILYHGPGIVSFEIPEEEEGSPVTSIEQTQHWNFDVNDPHWKEPEYVTTRESDGLVMNPNGRDPANLSGLVRNWTYQTRTKGCFFDGSKMYMFGRMQGSMANVKGPQFHVTTGPNANSYSPPGIGYIGYKDPDSLGGGISGNNVYDAQDKVGYVCQVDLADLTPANNKQARVKNSGRFVTPFDRYNGEDAYTFVDDRGDQIEFAYQFGNDLYLGVTGLYTPFNEVAYAGETAILKYTLVSN